MARCEVPIIARLLAHAGTAALVANRVYPIVRPQTPAGADGLPCITIRRTGRQGFYALAGAADLVSVRLTVTAWGATSDAAADVAEQVMEALERWEDEDADPPILDVLPVEGGDEDFDGDDAFPVDQQFEVMCRE